MKVLLAGGGTAGHINPAIAIAGYIKKMEPDAEILFIGNRDGMEQRLVKQAGFPIKSVVITGFKRSLSPKNMIHNFKTVAYSFESRSKAKKIITDMLSDCKDITFCQNNVTLKSAMNAQSDAQLDALADEIMQ